MFLGFFFLRAITRGVRGAARRNAQKPPYVPYAGPHGPVYKITSSTVMTVALVIAAIMVAAALAG